MVPVTQGWSAMPNILTSWKEISQYLGKGVRTVQRWEREAGLPVRRRDGAARHAVLAIPQELDEWARTRTRGPAGPVADSLRREIAILRDQTIELRKRIEFIEECGCAPVREKPRMTRAARTRGAERRFRSEATADAS
ncbi:MAG TPA: hypothetical protein VHE33_14045 [Acidobacteriaceae bacterium]|nr:hypothetical protein [Acidobacteriaceae bacterium]